MVSFVDSRKVFLTLSALLVLPMLISGNHLEKASTHDEASVYDQNQQTINIEVTLGDYWFKPDTIQVQAGQKVVLQLKNKGTVEHEFMAGNMVSDDMDQFKKDLFSGVSIEKKVPSEGSESGEESNEEGEEEHEGNMMELEPGQSGTMTFTLPESKTGTWKIGCFETTAGKPHYQFGMKGVLVVNPG
jgi:uncharacterized cupredoxin-like copper-binding protein